MKRGAQLYSLDHTQCEGESRKFLNHGLPHFMSRENVAVDCCRLAFSRRSWVEASSVQWPQPPREFASADWAVASHGCSPCLRLSTRFFSASYVTGSSRIS